MAGGSCFNVLERVPPGEKKPAQAGFLMTDEITLQERRRLAWLLRLREQVWQRGQQQELREPPGQEQREQELQPLRELGREPVQPLPSCHKRSESEPAERQRGASSSF